MEEKEDIPNPKKETEEKEETPTPKYALDTNLDSVKFPIKKRRHADSSVDLYAVQCSDCGKWRVVNTQEEFEDLRSKIIEEPFFCYRRKGITCEDQADINYDATRTWVIDRPNLPKTPQGFKRSLMLRKDYSKMDVYYISPLGKKLRTRNEVAAFIEENPEYSHVCPQNFFFTTPRIVESTIPQGIAISKKGSMTLNVGGKKKRKILPASPASESKEKAPAQ